MEFKITEAEIRDIVNLETPPLKAHPDRTLETLIHLRKTFDRWRDITISGGVGLGSFTN